MPATHMPGMAGEGVTIFQLFCFLYFLKRAFWTSETVYAKKHENQMLSHLVWSTPRESFRFQTWSSCVWSLQTTHEVLWTSFFVHMHKRGEENVHKHARKRSMIFENAGNNVIHTNQRFRGKQFTLAGHRFTLLIKTHPSSATLSFELAGPSLGGHIEKRQCSMSFNYKIYSWNWVSSSGFSKYQQYRSFPDRVNLCLNVVWILKMNIDVFDTTF